MDTSIGEMLLVPRRDIRDLLEATYRIREGELEFDDMWREVTRISLVLGYLDKYAAKAPEPAEASPK